MESELRIHVGSRHPVSLLVPRLGLCEGIGTSESGIWHIARGEKEASTGMPLAPNKEESGVIVAKQTHGGLSSPDKAPAPPSEGAVRRVPWGALGSRGQGSSTPCA